MAERLLVILAGPPASGKSTLARSLAARGGGTVAHLDLDELYREECGAAGLHSSARDGASVEAWHRSRSVLLERLPGVLRAPGRPGKYTVVIDDTAEHRSWRRRLAAAARECSSRLLVLELGLPVDVALARNASRESGAQVPEKEVARVASMLHETRLAVEHGAAGGGASVWELRAVVRIDASQSAEQVFGHAEAAISAAWEAPSVLEGPRAAAAAAPPPASAAHDADLRLRVVIRACMARLAAGDGAVGAGETGELLHALPRDATGSCWLSLREAAPVLSRAKAHALAAARAAMPGEEWGAAWAAMLEAARRGGGMTG